MRVPSREEYAHERLGEKKFNAALSVYDTSRRVKVLVDDFLTDGNLKGKSVLDVGCGLGFFSKRLKERGAHVTATDIGPHLLQYTQNWVGCRGELADALRLKDFFGPERFDVVLSSECIEHTPDPFEAIRQMAAVLKPGGLISISTPNILWHPVVRLATAIKLRPFDGHENFSSWKGIKKVLESCNVQIVREYGPHLFPFQFKLNRLSTWCDANLQGLRAVMINICILGQKRR